MSRATGSADDQGHDSGKFDTLHPLTLSFVEQITQTEIDAGEIQMVATVSANDSQEHETKGRNTHTVSLDILSDLVLGESFKLNRERQKLSRGNNSAVCKSCMYACTTVCGS